MGVGRNRERLLDVNTGKLSGFLVNGHLPRVSHKSCLLTNDKGDNEV